MRYVALTHLNLSGEVLNRGSILPENISPEDLAYFISKGAIQCVAPSGEIVEEEPLMEETDNETEYVEEAEELPEEDTEDAEETVESEAPEIDVMAGVVAPKRRKGGRS